MKRHCVLFFILISFRMNAQIFDTIPVIVHIIHNGEPYGSNSNIDSTQVYSQFDVLNEDYRMQNADIANTPAAFMSFIADMGLNFAPATVDPSGNILPEPGIDRINRNTVGFSIPPYNPSYIESNIKPSTIWPPDLYLNIWVLRISNGLLGYSTFPSNSGLGCMNNTPADPLRDGIVIHTFSFGRTGNVYAPFDLGRTATYEIAQWLGLRRLANADCGDDCVADTPTGDYTYGGCVSFPLIDTNCNNGPNGDMFCNFMTYVDDACKVMFTQGQKNRIDTALTNGTYQSALRVSHAADPLGTRKLPKTNEIQIYPNPSSGLFHISQKSLSEKYIHAEVYNFLGELIEKATFNDDKIVINMQNYSEGVYLVKLIGSNKTIYERIVKE